jgi:O-methyltransferase involved in polyketide biosynthesis
LAAEGDQSKEPHVSADEPPVPSAQAMQEDDDTERYIDSSIPNVARIYDYLLGGKENYAADREVAQNLITLVPDAVAAAHHNRQFLQRAVRFLAGEAGIRQFIDIGTGLPTQGNVHQIAQQSRPDAHVLYVDHDPVVVAHARALLADSETVAAIKGDLRDPDGILSHPVLRDHIDLDEPVAVLLIAILHFIEDSENPHGIVRRLVDAMPAGSYLALSHITADDVPLEMSDKARQLYARATASAVPRSRTAIERFFTGLTMADPGLVNVSAWRPEPASTGPARTIFYAGVGKKG